MTKRTSFVSGKEVVEWASSIFMEEVLGGHRSLISVMRQIVMTSMLYGQDEMSEKEGGE